MRYDITSIGWGGESNQWETQLKKYYTISVRGMVLNLIMDNILFLFIAALFSCANILDRVTTSCPQLLFLSPQTDRAKSGLDDHVQLFYYICGLHFVSFYQHLFFSPPISSSNLVTLTVAYLHTSQCKHHFEDLTVTGLIQLVYQKVLR